METQTTTTTVVVSRALLLNCPTVRTQLARSPKVKAAQEEEPEARAKPVTFNQPVPTEGQRAHNEQTTTKSKQQEAENMRNLQPLI